MIAQFLLLAPIALAVQASATAPSAIPAPGPDAAPWQAAFPARPAGYDVEKRSIYIAMRDGVRLAADIYLPKGLATGARVPALLIQNRYYRSAQRKSDPNSCRAVGSLPRYFTGRGYALVHVDVRGTGASFGTRKGELAADEVRDGGELVDWIVAQPWSSGRVGAMGQSYLGTAAELLPQNRRPALKAVATVSSTFDAYADLYFPGGILNRTFRSGWGALNTALDQGHADRVAMLSDVAAPCPVDADADGALRAAALAEHAGNFDSAAATADVAFRDDAAFAQGFPDIPAAQSASDAQALPFLSIEATMDSAYARSGVDRLANSRSSGQRLILAAGDHGAHDFYAPGVTSRMPSAFDQNAELIAFFDRYVDGRNNGYDRSPRVRWFTTGANAWRSAQAWPQPTTFVRYALADGRRLVRGHVRRSVDEIVPADAATGEHSRWNTTAGEGPVFYAERAASDGALAAYTSAPLTAPLEVTGSPVVTLNVADTAGDGDYFVYLEEVDAAGRSFIVGEGELRASSRAGAAPYLTAIAVPSGLRRDLVKISPGERLSLTVPMLPFSHRFAMGMRLRLVLAGSDHAHFQSASVVGRRWSVRLGSGGSTLSLPLAAR